MHASSENRLRRAAFVAVAIRPSRRLTAASKTGRESLTIPCRLDSTCQGMRLLTRIPGRTVWLPPRKPQYHQWSGCQGGTASQLCWCGTWAQMSPSVTPQVFETITTEFSKWVCHPCILLGMKVGDFSHPVILTIYILTSKGTALH